MASYTDNLHLKKPARTENYNVADANGNMDIIDVAVGDVKGTINNLSNFDYYYNQICENKVANGWELEGVLGRTHRNDNACVKFYYVENIPFVLLDLINDTLAVCQFQTDDSITSASAGNPALIGSTFMDTLTDQLIPVPNGAKYLAVSSLKTNITNTVKVAVDKAFVDLEKVLNGIKIPLRYWFYEEGSIRTNNGEVNPNDTGYKHTDYIDVRYLKSIYVVSNTQNNKFYNAFYDKDKAFISNITLTPETTIAVPEAAHYMRLSLNKDKVVVLEGTPKEIEYKKDVQEQIFDTFKLCTFNVGKWYNGATAGCPTEYVAERKKEWFKFMGKYQPDFLCMNEALVNFDADETIEAYDDIIANNYPYLSEVEGKEDKLASIYSGLTIATWSTVSSMFTFTKEIKGKTIHFLFGHLSLDDTTRTAQLAAIATYISQNEYCVVCGDFNIDAMTELEVFEGYNVANGGNFGTFETLISGSTSATCRSIDNIITTSNIKILNVEVPEVVLSDHAPLLATLKITG